MEGGAGGGGDVELVSKTLQVEHKLFYFDLKNTRGRYLKISEKTSATRSTIIVPVNGIVWFLDLFNYYVSTDDQEVFSKELQLDTKVFYFDIGENKRGRFLKESRWIAPLERLSSGNTAGGFSFVSCNVRGPVGQVWMPSSAITLAKTYLGVTIKPKGSSNVSEYKCTGPGTGATGVRVLADELAKPFLSMNLIHAGTWLLPVPSYY